MDKDQIPFLENAVLSCSDVEELLDCYLDEEMIDPLKKRFEEHTTTCEHCRTMVRDCGNIVQLARTLRDEPIPAEVSLRLREALAERVGHNVIQMRPRLTVVK